MEPTTNSGEGNNVVTPPQEINYHTISGGPETLKETLAKEKMVTVPVATAPPIPTANNNATSTMQQGNTTSPLPVRPIQNPSQQHIEESFFDRHITAIVFWGVILIGPIISFLSVMIGRVSSFGKYLMYIMQFSVPFLFLGIILLGAFNFHGKRNEIFKGIGYVILVPVLIALVGAGICLVVISGGSLFK